MAYLNPDDYKTSLLLPAEIKKKKKIVASSMSYIIGMSNSIYYTRNTDDPEYWFGTV